MIIERVKKDYDTPLTSLQTSDVFTFAGSGDDVVYMFVGVKMEDNTPYCMNCATNKVEAFHPNVYVKKLKARLIIED